MDNVDGLDNLVQFNSYSQQPTQLIILKGKKKKTRQKEVYNLDSKALFYRRGNFLNKNFYDESTRCNLFLRVTNIESETFEKLSDFCKF